ncbi:HlyD family type I secretion periplasmic adaptor subunit [Altererythrobacter arenosus]|uniref:Membrane fusion protein (MFP) family protein n=1 Tax=Altererythrobacter arenosus TaxID=3032592 RepID=A0ABY8FQ92_9SPHN|nr:HlyD family type I secretion periplasmic adaptor subunit [Altererythrobacter sp. CAU 1644]WFL76420.1 HlyD family type I secretion periplasmic adaptor subunit [Altererythrobacter sp. CAU 1644]
MAKLLDYLNGADAPVEEQEFVARKSANLILYAIIAFFVLLFAWAALTEIDRSVRGLGNVVPSSKLQIVSNLEGGVVEEILVKPGATVKKGDIIVRLSPTLSSAAFGSSTAEVSALQAKIARLDAEVRGVTPQYGVAPENQVAIEQSLHAARRAELQSAMAAGSARVNQAERAVIEAQSMLDARRSTLSALEQELDMIRPLVETKVIPRVDLIKTENDVLVARKEVDSGVAALARARAGVAEAKAQSAQMRSDWLSRTAGELSMAQAELSSKQLQLPALSDRVDRTVIRSPVTGIVNRVLVTTVGGTVAAGSPIAEIVPSKDALYIEAMIRPQDIANVSLGQTARLEITAYNQAIYGTLEGTVTSISPDAVKDERTGETFYTVEVQTTEQLHDQRGKPLKIGPGMMANVNLLGEKRSILSYVFTPITRLSQTAFRD